MLGKLLDVAERVPVDGLLNGWGDNPENRFWAALEVFKLAAGVFLVLFLAYLFVKLLRTAFFEPPLPPPDAKKRWVGPLGWVGVAASLLAGLSAVAWYCHRVAPPVRTHAAAANVEVVFHRVEADGAVYWATDEITSAAARVLEAETPGDRPTRPATGRTFKAWQKLANALSDRLGVPRAYGDDGKLANPDGVRIPTPEEHARFRTGIPADQFEQYGWMRTNSNGELQAVGGLRRHPARHGLADLLGNAFDLGATWDDKAGRWKFTLHGLRATSSPADLLVVDYDEDDVADPWIGARFVVRMPAGKALTPDRLRFGWRELFR